MSMIEKNGLMRYVDKDGNQSLLYPITKAELVDGAVQTVNGIAPDDNGNVEVPVPEAVKSYNDLEDKPVGETTVYGDTLTWDGNTDGLVNVMGAMFKVSDAVPTKEDCVNGLSLTIAGQTNTATGEQAQSAFADDGFWFMEGLAFVPADNYYFADEDATFPEAGVYFVNTDGMVATKLVIPGYTGFDRTVVKKLDGNFLPEGTPWIESEMITILPACTLPVDESEGLAVIMTPFSLTIGKTYTVTYNGQQFECTAQDAINMGFGICVGNLGVLLDEEGTGEPFIIADTASEQMGNPGFEGAVLPLDGSTEVTISIEGPLVTFHMLPETLMPDVRTYFVKATAKGAMRHVNSKPEDDSYAVGENAFSEGSNTTASGTNSHAEGAGTVASGSCSHAEGFTTTASHQESHAEGYDTTASGMRSHAEGSQTTASGSYSHAEGNAAKAEGEGSHAEGYDTTASGSYSHAEGYAAKAEGEGSHAEGYDTTASGSYSHAEGHVTTASGFNSHAEGAGTVASSTNSHAEGNSTTASGTNSHAEGAGTVASGTNSHAEGMNTVAQRACQHVQGALNIVDTEGSDETERGKYAHIVGNGTSVVTRSNAHTLDWDGNAWFAGDVYVGSTSGTNKDEGSVKLSKEGHEHLFDRAITTSGDGAAYTVTVEGITALTAGISFTMIPHVTSTTKAATLNVNGLGAKGLRRPLSSNNATAVAPTAENWLSANKPVTVMYNGLYWVAMDMARPYGPDIYGTVAGTSVGYDNTTSGMTASTMQAAIDELYALISQLTNS